MLVLTGKGYGVTNLVVLDRAGNVLMERSVEVKGPRTDVVVMYRGIERETYSCAPMCQRQIVIGDSAVFFDTGIQQATERHRDRGSASGCQVIATGRFRSRCAGAPGAGLLRKACLSSIALAVR